MEKVEASILGTIYRNDDNGYTVLTAREGRREITVVGTLPELHPGEQAVFTGEWISHPTYGNSPRPSWASSATWARASSMAWAPPRRR